MSHEMIRREARAAYGDGVDSLNVAIAGDTREDDIVDVWPLLPPADAVATTDLTDSTAPTVNGEEVLR